MNHVITTPLVGDVVAFCEKGTKYWLLQLEVEVDPALKPVIVTLPQAMVVVAASVTPTPVGSVSIIAGGDDGVRHPDPMPGYGEPLSDAPPLEMMLDGIPPVDSMKPVTMQLGPPPVDVNGVEAA
jgi:hypothetical protein